MRKVVNLADINYGSGLLIPIWSEFTAFLENALLLDPKETEQLRKKYAYVIITFSRLLNQKEALIDDMNQEELDSLSDILRQTKSYIRRDDLIGKLAADWAYSLDATEGLVQQVEESFFTHKDLPNLNEGLNPDECTKTRWIKLIHGASEVIKS
jgi:hypothetical protein